MLIDARRLLLAGLFAWPAAAPCQRISGRVTDALTGQTLSGAQIFVEQAGVRVASAMADSSGAFSIAVTVLPGSEVVLRVMRVGYRLSARTLTVEKITTDSLTVALESVAVELSKVVVSAQRTERRLRQAGFYDRAAQGFGHFVTEETILARNATLATDAFRGIPGVRVVPSPRHPGSYEIYMARAQGGVRRAQCPPKVFLDGLVTSSDFDKYLTPEEIAGIEIYRGPAETPAQFGGAESDCGVIVIWSK